MPAPRRCLFHDESQRVDMFSEITRRMLLISTTSKCIDDQVSTLMLSPNDSGQNQWQAT
jgi:hypothetical protein